MKKSLVLVGCLVICAAVLFAVTEQPLNVKPGLWQVERTITYSGLPLQYQAMLDRLTPEQKAAMGIDAPHPFKTCRTEKQVNTSWVQGDNNCKWTVLKSTSSDLEVHGTACREGKNEGRTSSVDVTIHVLDPEHLRGNIHGTETGNGINATLDGTYTAKWIGATCSVDGN